MRKYACKVANAARITRIAIAQLIGRFRRRSALFWKALRVFHDIYSTVGHGFDFPMSVKFETECIPLRGMPGGHSIGCMMGMVVGSMVAAAVVCMVVFVVNTRIALRVDARVVWMTCMAL